MAKYWTLIININVAESLRYVFCIVPKFLYICLFYFIKLIFSLSSSSKTFADTDYPKVCINLIYFIKTIHKHIRVHYVMFKK